MEEKVHRSQKCLKDNGKYRKWKKEELEYLRKICYGRGYKEIAEMITERFGMECSETRVRNIPQELLEEAKRKGITRHLISGRISQVWSVEKACTTETMSVGRPRSKVEK